MRLVIAPFRNEEYLLPFWLKHHREIFDHGVMIDYHSTDASADIVRSLVPDWELVPARYPRWDPIDEDFERMTHEARFQAWKIGLNITEFLCAESLARVEARVEKAGLEGAHARGVIMADPLGETLPPPDPEKPLIEQRAFGHYEDEISWGGWLRRHGIPLIQPRYASGYRSELRVRPFLFKKKVLIGRARLYHKAEQGAYLPGRHQSNLKNLCAPPQDDLLCLHYYFSPWNDQMRRRVMTQSEIFSERHQKLSAKSNHLLYARDPAAMERERRRLAKKSRDLSKNPVFRRNALGLSEL